MNLYCSFVGEKTFGYIFQNEHREDHGRQRSRPSQAPSPRISPEEETRIVAEQGRIVGADAGANLEQVILHEEAVRLEQIRQNKIQEILTKAQELQDEFAALFGNNNIRADFRVEYERIWRKMAKLVKDANDLGFSL